MRGRVASVNSIFVGSSNELGAFESGLAAKILGTVSCGGFWWLYDSIDRRGYGGLLPKFRKLDLTADVEEQENE